jgi:hypothetical protein
MLKNEKFENNIKIGIFWFTMKEKKIIANLMFFLVLASLYIR